MSVLQSDQKSIVGKWMDKREVMFLTTKSVPVMSEVETRRGLIKKPSTILEYNKVKSFIDVSDQMASYGTTVRKGIKWYRKVAVELLTNTAVVNAYIVFQKMNVGSKLGITEFREKLAIGLIFGDGQPITPRASMNKKHELQEHNPRKRGRCSVCYAQLSEKKGRATALQKSKQVTTKCNSCPDFQFMCVNCYIDKHEITLKV